MESKFLQNILEIRRECHSNIWLEKSIKNKTEYGWVVRHIDSFNDHSDFTDASASMLIDLTFDCFPFNLIQISKTAPTKETH
jgi:hypothetical protein